MATNKKIPGVDKEALEGLANQFPRTQGPSSEGSTVSPGSAGKVAKGDADTDKMAATKPPDKPQRQAGSEPSVDGKQKDGSPESGAKAAETASKSDAAASGRTDSAAASKSTGPTTPGASPPGIPALAYLPLIISLIALALALAALSPPQIQNWLQAQLGNRTPIEFSAGTKAEFEARFRENAAAIQLTDKRLAVQENRLKMVDSGSSSEAAANQGSGTGRRLAELETLMTGRLSKIETELSTLRGGNLGSSKLYLIALRLHITAQTPEPFSDEVKAAVQVGSQGEPIDTALQVLGRHAGNGVASRAQLTDYFQRHLAPVLRGGDVDAGRSLFVNFRTWFNGLFLDDGDGTIAVANAVAIVELAAQNLARGRLHAASEQLAQFKGVLATRAAPWLAQARARVAVDNATATLLTEAYDRFMAADD